MIDRQINVTEVYQREIDYAVSVSIAKTLKSKSLLTDKEYNKIIYHFVQKHYPPISRFRVIM